MIRVRLAARLVVLCQSDDVSDTVAAKRELRAAMRALRIDIASDPGRRAARSATIAERLIRLVDAEAPWIAGAPRRAMVYDPLPGEPDLADFVSWCDDAGIEVFEPEVVGLDLRVMPGDVDPDSLALVVTPGLAFTADGRRLGQGGGHYDRFLGGVSAGCLLVGVAFAEQVVVDIPVEVHDVVLDAVVSDA